MSASAVIGGGRRLVRAPGLWLGCWAALAAMAWVVGAQVQLVVAAAVGPFDALDLDRVVFGIADALRAHPDAAVGSAAVVIGGGLVAGLGWLLVSPVVIGRLAGHTTLESVGKVALAGLPGVVVQSLWHALLRAVLVLVVLMSAQPLPPWAVGVLVTVVWLAAGVALDATRVAVVTGADAPLHPRTAWRGLVRVARRPRVLVPGVLLGAGQLVLTALVVWLALRGLGSGGVWAARGLSLVSVGLGLWRVGIVVEDAAGDE